MPLLTLLHGTPGAVGGPISFLLPSLAVTVTPIPPTVTVGTLPAVGITLAHQAVPMTARAPTVTIIPLVTGPRAGVPHLVMEPRSLVTLRMVRRDPIPEEA